MCGLDTSDRLCLFAIQKRKLASPCLILSSGIISTKVFLVGLHLGFGIGYRYCAPLLYSEKSISKNGFLCHWQLAEKTG